MAAEATAVTTLLEVKVASELFKMLDFNTLNQSYLPKTRELKNSGNFRVYPSEFKIFADKIDNIIKNYSIQDLVFDEVKTFWMQKLPKLLIMKLSRPLDTKTTDDL